MLNAARFLAKRTVHTTAQDMARLRVAVIGQSNFGAEVYKSIKEKGHEVVGVFTVPDIQVFFFILKFIELEAT